MASYAILAGPVDHDGVRYATGEGLTLTPAEAAPLLELGVIAIAHPTKEAAKPRKPAP